MFGLDKLALIAGAITGAVLAGIVAIPVAYTIGKHDGRQIERQASLQRSMDTIRERNKTNAEINALDDAGLCRALGGVPVEDRCE